MFEDVQIQESAEAGSLSDFSIRITNGDGREVEVPPLIHAMMRVLLQSREEISAREHGCVELHFGGSAKVHGKLRFHTALEHFDGGGP